MFLSACGALNALIPDQTIEGGILGIGTAGVDVELSAAVDDAAVGGAQLITVTEFTGSLEVDSVPVEAIDELPDFVEAAAITETIALGDSVVVTYPTTGPAASFTLTGLAVNGSVTISGTEFAFPVLSVDGLAVLFDGPTCAGDVCTYGTASSLPELDVALVAAAVDAYSALLQNGGTAASS